MVQSEAKVELKITVVERSLAGADQPTKIRRRGVSAGRSGASPKTTTATNEGEQRYLEELNVRHSISRTLALPVTERE
jgi:hypothetical protein